MKQYEQIKAIGACTDALAWLKEQTSATQAWRDCHRGDWMLWMIGRVAGGKPERAARKKLVLTACKCARLALKYVEKGEDRPRKAILTAERWARGKATIKEVRAAADAADAVSAADAAAAAAAAATAYATAAAADAADAAYAARAAAYAAARAKTLAECADIVRRAYPKPPRMPKVKS